MVMNLTDEEKKALNRKIEEPDSVVKCPRCGNVILYKEFACGCKAYCKTDGCIEDSVRGI